MRASSGEVGFAGVRQRFAARGERGLGHGAGGGDRIGIKRHALVVEDRAAVQAQHGALHPRRREEVARPYGEAPGRLGVQAQLHRVGAVVLRARAGGHAVGHFLLHHDGGAFQRREPLEVVEHHGGGHGVGQVRHQLVG